MASEEFRDRPVVVLGAASGIGRATALAFARCGAKVAALDVNTDPLAAFADEMRTAGAANALTGAVDVRDGASVRDAMQRA